jgi:hypothetical protein
MKTLLCEDRLWRGLQGHTGGCCMQGSVLYRSRQVRTVKHSEDGQPVQRSVSAPSVCHADIISQSFWDAHPDILA